MRMLSAIKENDFTVKIHDVIFPEMDVTNSDPLDYLLIVMDLEETDLGQVLK